MLKRFIKTYYKLFDEKLENGTIIVLIISVIIVLVSLITNDTNAGLLTKVSVLESRYDKDNIVEINGIKYKLIFEEY